MKPNDLPQSFQTSSLEGKVAVVTGSTQGLGEATARLFQERGCKGIVLTGRNEERGKKLVEELITDSCRVIFVRADLECMEDVRKIFKVTDLIFGTVDILVNAAATTARGSLWDTTPEEYDRIMNINTRAPFFLMQDAVRIMEREKVAGSIINISSTASYGSHPMLAAYGMSKGALNVATKNAAYVLAWSKIRVNALTIGWMDSPGEDSIQRSDGNDKNWLARGEAQQPFGRLLKPEEVAKCIAFCASEESGMMTGCLIDFDQSVFGAGPPPVPLPKEQWARPKGMTFSFEESSKKTKATASKTKKEKKETKRLSKTDSPPKDSKVLGKTTPQGSHRKELNTKKQAKSPKKTKSPNKASEPSKTYLHESPASPTSHYLQANRGKFGDRKIPEPPIAVDHSTESETDDEDSFMQEVAASKFVKEKEETKPSKGESLYEEKGRIAHPMSPKLSPSPSLPKQEIRSPLSTIESPKPPSRKFNLTPPVTPGTPSSPAPAITVHSPDPTEFKRMIRQQMFGDESMNQDDYLPGTDPFSASKKKAQLAKTEYGSSNSPKHTRGYPLPPMLSPPKTTKTVHSSEKITRSAPPAPQRRVQVAMDKIPRPNVYVSAGNSPDQEKQNNKIPSTSDHGDYRPGSVDDWLTGEPGKAQRRTYKVKSVRVIK